MWDLMLVIMFVLAMVLFSYMGHHLINSLITLENMVLVIYFSLVLLGEAGGSSSLQVLVLFVLSVSSASLGLSLLVSMARSHGNDLFKSYSLLW